MEIIPATIKKSMIYLGNTLKKFGINMNKEDDITEEYIENNIHNIHARNIMPLSSLSKVVSLLKNNNDIQNLKISEYKLTFKYKNTTVTIFKSGKIWLIGNNRESVAEAYLYLKSLDYKHFKNLFKDSNLINLQNHEIKRNKN
jgi:TATA-box binding protein (TBP) (component of TFIID and TFIIIB)